MSAAAAGATALEMAEALEPTGAEEDDDEIPEELPVSPEPEDVIPDMLLTDASDFEDLRDMLAEEGRPRVLILTIEGDRVARQRADWATDLLQAGGFEIVRCEGVDLANAESFDADIWVLCVADESLEDAVSRLRVAANKPPLAIAGRSSGDLDEDLCVPIELFLFEGGDVLLRLEYLAKLVAVRRLDRDNEDVEVRLSLLNNALRLFEKIKEDQP